MIKDAYQLLAGHLQFPVEVHRAQARPVGGQGCDRAVVYSDSRTADSSAGATFLLLRTAVLRPFAALPSFALPTARSFFAAGRTGGQQIKNLATRKNGQHVSISNVIATYGRPTPPRTCTSTASFLGGVVGSHRSTVVSSRSTVVSSWTGVSPAPPTRSTTVILPTRPSSTLLTLTTTTLKRQQRISQSNERLGQPTAAWLASGGCSFPPRVCRLSLFGLRSSVPSGCGRLCV